MSEGWRLKTGPRGPTLSADNAKNWDKIYERCMQDLTNFSADLEKCKKLHSGTTEMIWIFGIKHTLVKFLGQIK